MPETSPSTRSASVPSRKRPRVGAITALMAIVVLVMGALAAGVRSASADALFGDDFETGDLSRWSTVSGLAVQQQVVFGGAWAARGTSSGAGVPASAQRNLAVAQSDVTL